MNATVEQPLRLVLANDSSIQVRPGQAEETTHVVVVHVPWPASGAHAADGAGSLFDDDLANATWEDAEWQ